MRGAQAAAGWGTHTFEGFDDIVEIGSGGFSTVYRAREIAPDRFVALKVLSVADVTPHALESFRRETVALGAVSSHPNIVTLYRQESLPDGRPVLVLELCDGSISERLRGGACMPAREAVSVAVKIAGALESAHRAGMLHRDVKPQNILCTKFGEPALADFGVARLQASAQATVGVFGFTTLHAPPELLEGGELSCASDVYELASTLYQMLAGKAAFTSFEHENPASVILRILRDPVVPLQADGTPPALSELLVWSMSKEQRERPQTAAEFAEALRAIEMAQGWVPTGYWVRNPDGTGEHVTRAPGAAPPAPVPTPVAAPPAAEWRPPQSPASVASPAGRASNAALEHTVGHERSRRAVAPLPPRPPADLPKRDLTPAYTAAAALAVVAAAAAFTLLR